ncbi:MAG TPA: tripartite tricarboxylate transporter substrate binding protein [Burkholderiales bacterium]|nr:tripartite tricarboxylate transporter substrate binding protein [Burkholderiales bacterium]
MRFLVLLSLALGALPAAGQSPYPSKPIHFMIGVPPGGPTDTVARSIAPALTEALGQPIVVENKPGGSASLATDAVAKAAPDGYTLGFIYITHATNPTMHPSLPYDTLKDFAAVAQVGSQQMLLLANPSFPPKNVQELIAAAKASPGKLDYGASDPGSAPHLAGELFKMLSGTRITPVPYKGTAPALTDLIAGQIPFMFVSNISGLPHVKSGKLKVLAVTGAQRLSLAPEVPTVAESGLPGYEITSWYGIVAPARTPREIILKLNAEVNRIARDPGMKARMLSQGLELPETTPEQFDAHIRSEIVKWRRVLKGATS